MRMFLTGVTGFIGSRIVPELIKAGHLGRSFPWARGWTQASVDRLSVDGAVALFGRNYDRLRPIASR